MGGGEEDVLTESQEKALAAARFKEMCEARRRAEDEEHNRELERIALKHAQQKKLREEEELAGADAAALDVLIAALGLALFVAGNATQFAAHRQFAGLRRARAGGGAMRFFHAQ